MIFRIYNVQDKDASNRAFWNMQLAGYKLYCAIEDLLSECEMDDQTYDWLESLEIKLAEIESGDLDYDGSKTEDLDIDDE